MHKTQKLQFFDSETINRSDVGGGGALETMPEVISFHIENSYQLEVSEAHETVVSSPAKQGCSSAQTFVTSHLMP